MLSFDVSIEIASWDTFNSTSSAVGIEPEVEGFVDLGSLFFLLLSNPLSALFDSSDPCSSNATSLNSGTGCAFVVLVLFLDKAPFRCRAAGDADSIVSSSTPKF